MPNTTSTMMTPPTDEGNVQLVNPHDGDAIEIGKLAAKQNQVEFKSIGLGYEIVLSEGKIYHLIILANAGNPRDGEELIFFFTIVESISEPVVLLYKILQFSFTESHPHHHHLLIGNHPHVSAVHAGATPSPPIPGTVQYVNTKDPKVAGAAKLAATQNGWELVEVSVGFQITFSRGPEGAFYYLVSVGKDSNGVSKFFFTAVETFFIPVVLLFSELSHYDTLQMGGDEGKVRYVDPNDDNAKAAARLAAVQKELEFVAINQGITIIFSHGQFYHLHVSAKNRKGEPISLLAIVADSGGRMYPLMMTSKALQMGNDGQVKDDGNVQLSWEEQVFPHTTEDGNVQPVDPDDDYAKEAANLAATQNGVEFMQIAFGFQIMFSHGPFYHLVFLAKDDRDTLKCYFTIVETIVKPVVLLFAPLKFPYSRTDGESEGNRSALLNAGDDKNLPIIPVYPRDQKAIEAAKLAATVYEVDFFAVVSGFKIIFPHGEVYYLVFSAKKEYSKLYFTIVETLFKPVVLLFQQMEKSSLETIPIQSGNGEPGKVKYIYVDDPNAKEPGMLAATENNAEFRRVCLGFQISFSHGSFYHLVILAKKDGVQKLFFTIVAADIPKPRVLLFTPVNFAV